MLDANETVRESAAEALAEYEDAALQPSMDAIMDAYKPGTVPIRWQVVAIKNDTPIIYEDGRWQVITVPAEAAE